jgi:hypothetical protein
MVEHLPSKAQSSNPSTERKREYVCVSGYMATAVGIVLNTDRSDLCRHMQRLIFLHMTH